MNPPAILTRGEDADAVHRYDNNQVTCDGSVDLVNSEDVNAKMRACGFHVLGVEDGCYDVEGIVRVLEEARESKEKPTFINIRTTIGLGSAVAGKAAAHGAPFGVEEVKRMKTANGFDPEQHFVISDEVRRFFADLPSRGERLVEQWNAVVEEHRRQYPELGAEFQARVRGDTSRDWHDLIPDSFPTSATATRASSGLVLNPIAKEISSLIVGTADLSPSVNMAWDGKVDFQHVRSPASTLSRPFTSVYMTQQSARPGTTPNADSN